MNTPLTDEIPPSITGSQGQTPTLLQRLKSLPQPPVRRNVPILDADYDDIAPGYGGDYDFDEN
jgi:hypothetical protein